MNRIKIYLSNGDSIDLVLIDDNNIDFTDLDSIAEYFEYDGDSSEIIKVEMYLD
jgi:hypothetical protein